MGKIIKKNSFIEIFNHYAIPHGIIAKRRKDTFELSIGNLDG